jgi:CTP:molybdopterin cytidylyltransferase MocA
MVPWLLVYQLLSSGAGQSLEGVHFDLALARPAEESDETIVVTGRRRNHRLKADLAETEAPLLPRADVGLFGSVRAAAEVEQSVLEGGAISNRAMVKLQIPF